MVKEKFDRSKAYANIGTIGFPRDTLMLHSILASTNLPKPVLLCEEQVGQVESFDYRKIENELMASFSIDCETTQNLIMGNQPVSFSVSGMRYGKNYLANIIEERRQKKLKELEEEIKSFVPSSVYNLINSF